MLHLRRGVFLNAITKPRKATRLWQLQGQDDCDPIWMARAYRAMLAAAPQPSAEAVATVEVMMTGGNAGIATRIVEIDDPLRERLLPGTKLYTHTPDDTALLRQALEALNHMNVQDRPKIIATLRARVHH